MMATSGSSPSSSADEDDTGVCGRDNRVRVQTKTEIPFKWICRLSIADQFNTRYGGTGFKIFTNTGRSMVVTAAHNIYVTTLKKDGPPVRGLCNKIIVYFPGEESIVVEGKEMYVPPEYKEKGLKSDYGLIPLPEGIQKDEGFGWEACITDRDLCNLAVTVTGYPSDKPRGTMWKSESKLQSRDREQLNYTLGSPGGNSGSPVYFKRDTYWTVIAVHAETARASCPNRAFRLRPEVIFRFLQFMGQVKIFNIRAADSRFSDVYLRCAVSEEDVTKPKGGGLDTVNCQYKPPQNTEQFYIYPVAMHPSTAQQDNATSHKVAIRSVPHNNIHLRLDPNDMTSYTPDGGGGTVNCQWGVGEREVFYKEENTDNSVSFRSVKDDKCFIRMDGTKVKSRTAGGGGVVNCQWFDDKDPGHFERFVLVPKSLDSDTDDNR